MRSRQSVVLPVPGLAGHDHEPFAIVDPVDQLPFRIVVLLGVEDEARVGRQRERLVAKAVELFVHASAPGSSRLTSDDGGRQEDHELGRVSVRLMC